MGYKLTVNDKLLHVLVPSKLLDKVSLMAADMQVSQAQLVRSVITKSKLTELDLKAETIQVTIPVSSTQYERVRRIATKSNISMSAVVRAMLEQATGN